MPDQPPNPYAAPSSNVVPLELEAYEEFLKDPRPLGRSFVGLMMFRGVTIWVTTFLSIPKEVLTAYLIVNSTYPLVMAVLYFLWLYRCAVNAQRLDRVVSPTPAIAIGSYFIPLFNLVGPFVMMSRMVAVTFRRSLKPTVAPWVLPWWLCCLAMLAQTVIIAATNKPLGISPFVGVAVWSIGAICLTVIVLRLSAAQAEIRVLAAGGQQQLGQSVTLRQSGVSSSELEAKAGAAGIPAKRSGLPQRRSQRR